MQELREQIFDKSMADLLFFGARVSHGIVLIPFAQFPHLHVSVFLTVGYNTSLTMLSKRAREMSENVFFPQLVTCPLSSECALPAT
jgi:hypothetical protein